MIARVTARLAIGVLLVLVAACGSSTDPVRLKVSWPSGKAEEFGDVPVDRWTTVTEGTAK